MYKLSELDSVCERYRALCEAECQFYYGHGIGDEVVKMGTSLGRIEKIAEVTGQRVQQASVPTLRSVTYGGVEFINRL